MTADDRSPAAGHPDLDTLADLHAGALDDPAAEQVRGHVAGCAQCAAALDALDAVQGQLRALPAPTLPAEVATRLHATLADLRTITDAPANGARPTKAGEPVEKAGEPVEKAGEPAGRRAEDELELARDRRRRRLGRALAGVAAAVAVIAAGASVTAVVRSGGDADDSASSAAAAGDSAAAARTSGGFAPDSTTQEGTGNRGGAVPAYNHDTLAAALPAIAEPRGGHTLAGTAGVMSDPARRTACARSIPAPRGSFRTVARILYEGRPGYVFVYADGDRLTGYVVTDACGSATGLPATLLDTVS
jgi:anti-sigma factor RsiW